MISLEMSTVEGKIKLHFDAPDKPGETIRLDELAVFALHLEVIKARIVELTNKALQGTEGYDLVISD